MDNKRPAFMDKPLTSDEYAAYIEAASELKFTGDQFQNAMVELYDKDGKDKRPQEWRDLKAALDAQVAVGSKVTG